MNTGKLLIKKQRQGYIDKYGDFSYRDINMNIFGCPYYIADSNGYAW